MITHLATVGSTNDWLAEHGADLSDESWVFADVQTGGRGRRGRAWASLPGNLLASVLVRPHGADRPPPQLSFVAALALIRTLDVWVASERLQLKWPNDLLLDGAKVSGILLEAQGGAVVIGFGVNLAMHPEGQERPAISLAAAGLVPPLPAELMSVLAATFGAARADWQAHGFAGVRSAWLDRAAGLGDTLVARLGVETVTGRFEGLAADGALELRLDNGTLRAVHAGEVFAL